MQVGFIGLGQMGRPIAANLLRAGHELLIWNRSQGPVRELTAQGAQAAHEPADTARADVLMSMLADDDALRGATAPRISLRL